MLLFCIGIVAMLEIRRVTTSSDVCSSLTCLLPISLKAQETITYKSKVLIIETATIHHHRFIFCKNNRFILLAWTFINKKFFKLIIISDF